MSLIIKGFLSLCRAASRHSSKEAVGAMKAKSWRTSQKCCASFCRAFDNAFSITCHHDYGVVARFIGPGVSNPDAGIYHAFQSCNRGNAGVKRFGRLHARACFFARQQDGHLDPGFVFRRPRPVSKRSTRLLTALLSIPWHHHAAPGGSRSSGLYFLPDGG